jgi:hypothetical protein
LSALQHSIAQIGKYTGTLLQTGTLTFMQDYQLTMSSQPDSNQNGGQADGTKTPATDQAEAPQSTTAAGGSTVASGASGASGTSNNDSNSEARGVSIDAIMRSQSGDSGNLEKP